MKKADRVDELRTEYDVRKMKRVQPGALAHEELWWNKGHTLSEASTALETVIDGPVAGYVVGEPVAGLAGLGALRLDRMLIVEMLYAFAVECWLKGFIVGSCVRPSKKNRRELGEWLRQNQGPDIGDPDEAILADLRAMHSPEGKARLDQIESLQQVENEDRAERLTRHQNHDLASLAQTAGLTVSDAVGRYLDFLSDCVQIGRYPAHNQGRARNSEEFISFVTEEDSAFVKFAWSDERAEVKANLNAAIRERHDRVEDAARQSA